MLTNSLTTILSGEAAVTSDKLRDYTLDSITPEAVVFPSSLEEVSRVMALASKEGWMVVPRGGGTQMALGNPPAGVDVVVATTRLNHLLAHEPDDMTATVEAGMTLSALQEHLAGRGQVLPLEAPRLSQATIGGILAANASGPLRLAYGTARDWLLGLRIVHADGTTTKSGGKVVKNVTGYDLNKLYIGSLGTLGIIVEATFKLAPAPRYDRALLGTFSSTAAASKVAKELLGKSDIPQALQLIKGEALQRFPWVGPSQKDAIVLVSVFAGRAAAVERQVDEAAQLMKQADARTVEGLPVSETRVLLQAITDLGWGGEPLPWLMLKVSLLPSDVGEMLEKLPSVVVPLGSPSVVADVGFGLVQLLWWNIEGQSVDGSVEAGIVTKLREMADSFMGHVVVERCPAVVKASIDVWGESVNGLEIRRRIKGELDPSNILNPGRFIGGI